MSITARVHESVYVNKAAYGDEPPALQTPNDWISCGAIAAARCAHGAENKTLPNPLQRASRIEQSGL